MLQEKGSLHFHKGIPHGGYSSYYGDKREDTETEEPQEQEVEEEQDGIDESIKRDVELILQNMSEDGVEYVIEKIIEEDSD